MGGVLLYNPRSCNVNPRIPNSIMAVAASIQGRYEFTFVDGNLDPDPEAVIVRHLASGKYAALGVTVMPGPQLRQAAPICRNVRNRFPHVKIVWGGYFPSNQPEAVLNSGYVDVIVNGMGDKCFPMLLDAFREGTTLQQIPNLIYLKDGHIFTTSKDAIYEPDTLPSFPYAALDKVYPLHRYLPRTWLGQKTISYHSSFGCPFTCSFCAVVPIYEARWKGVSAARIYQDVMHIRNTWGGDAIEFHDNNFFVSEKRTIAFSKLIAPEKMNWWGEGRIDTLHKYRDESLAEMRASGCRMIFFGAETGNDDMLRQMDKGGTQTGDQIRAFVQRIRNFDIVPELSFVLGFPGKDEQTVWRQIEEDIRFIREIKCINPQAEIIIYVYSPVPVEGSALFEQVKAAGFQFPKTLEDWVSPAWANFDLRKNPLTPWLTPAMVDRIRNFEVVLNGQFPSLSDTRLRGWKRNLVTAVSHWRYATQTYGSPYEIKALHKLFRYRQPEIQGF